MRPLLLNATEAHLPVIHELAHAIWPNAFKDILTKEQIAYMLDWMYSLPSLHDQWQSGHHFLLVSQENYSGYCSYQEHKDFTQLHKIYILPEMQGIGLGKILLSEVIKRTRKKGQDKLRLNVNRYNKAVDFYQKAGFKIIREVDNDIGGGFYMNDYVMELSL